MTPGHQGTSRGAVKAATEIIDNISPAFTDIPSSLRREGLINVIAHTIDRATQAPLMYEALQEIVDLYPKPENYEILPNKIAREALKKVRE